MQSQGCDDPAGAAGEAYMSEMQENGGRAGWKARLISIGQGAIGLVMLTLGPLIWTGFVMAVFLGLAMVFDGDDDPGGLTIEECMEQYDVSRNTCVEFFLEIERRD